ncbi:MAG: hypothetical protein QNL91_06045 [Candidatus Krumholzibacteria bacterium]|nr:hypothetical protein [Candidatus Krumholzibacteria bacterium]
MQKEFDAMAIDPGIRILGINQVGQESQNDLNCEGRDIPWLQETMTELVWVPWDVTYRDVVIVDGTNRRLAAFNLTDKNLAVAANYEALKTLLLETSQ